MRYELEPSFSKEPKVAPIHEAPTFLSEASRLREALMHEGSRRKLAGFCILRGQMTLAGVYSRYAFLW